VNIENVKGMCVYIPWDHNGMNVKYLPCVFEGVYVLDMSNLPEDLSYEDIPMKFLVYDTQDYFDTIWHLLILLWIDEKKTSDFAMRSFV